MQLNEIRKEEQFQAELLNLIETLKNIAASHYHMMEKEKERFDRFMDAFSEFFRVVNLVDIDDPLVRVESDRLGIIVVTSDSGFMGGLNQGVIREAANVQGDRPDEKTALIVIGDKGATVLGDAGREFKFFPGINQDTMYEQSVEIKDYIVGEALEKRIGKTVIVYPRPLSFTSQTIETASLLPCAELFDIESTSEVSQRIKHEGVIADATKLIVESSFSDMLEYLAGVWLTSKFFEVFEDSKLAEFSARAMHLEGSFDKVEKEYKKIKHMAQKASRENIDKGMRESFGATRKKRRRKKAPA
ncbi:MAG: F0F1 ATP synthase subunit gamma [Kiritimatiellia bacterium]